MDNLSIWVLLLLLGGIFGLWQEAMAAREKSLLACRSACRQAGVQLLDDTVVLMGWRIVRRPLSTHSATAWRWCDQWAIERRYGFEFTATGTSRQPGLIVLCGGEIVVVALEGRDLLVL